MNKKKKKSTSKKSEKPGGSSDKFNDRRNGKMTGEMARERVSSNCLLFVFAIALWLQL
jgi:hypothetical protein